MTVTLSVEDARALWAAAAERALAAPGMTLADVLDTIGPREDPPIADCLAALLAPAAVPGCQLDDFSVREAIAPVAGSAELIRLPGPLLPRHMALLPAANG